MATYTEYDLPPSECERCGYSTFDGYCQGYITFDDGEMVPVCYACYLDFRFAKDDGELADSQRRGVENYRDRIRESLLAI